MCIVLKQGKAHAHGSALFELGWLDKCTNNRFDTNKTSPWLAHAGEEFPEGTSPLFIFRVRVLGLEASDHRGILKDVVCSPHPIIKI